jgi:threonine/homoserine/homoserine lactone efflux protein
VTLADLGIHGLPLFATAALLVNLTPGPDMLFVIGAGASRGHRAGVLAALGVSLGCLLHVALAAAGLSALLAASATAFAVVKWIGAAYLVWTGIVMLRNAGRAAPGDAGAPRVAGGTGAKVFWQGAATNALNPKVALFFLAFLPQFIVPGGAHQSLAFLALGLLFTAGGTLVNVVVGWTASGLRARLAGRPGAARAGAWLQRVAGALFVALGAKLAFGSR